MLNKLAVRVAALGILAVPFSVARANLVLTSLDQFSGQGFGAITTIFTIQTPNGQTQTEQGCYAYNNGTPGSGAFNGADNTFAGISTTAGNYCTEGGVNDVAPGSPKNQIPSLSSVGITSVSQIGLLLNLNQVSDQGITIQNGGLVLSFYNPLNGDIIYSATLANNWCNIASLCSGSNTLLASEQGQGGSGFTFVLDAAQQAGLLAAMGGTFNGNILVGASGFLGCAGTQTANCKEANDGADDISLAAVNQPTTVPEPSTTFLMASGLIGLAGVVRRRRNK
jgi:PEP-CTERM motif